jgi:hypothetical protein
MGALSYWEPVIGPESTVAIDPALNLHLVPRLCLPQLQDPATCLRVRAIYKPRVYGDAGGWHRTPMEYVAYRLNRLLGLDLVPPVAYRCGAP